MTQINSNIILVLGGLMGIGALLVNSNIFSFIFIGILILIIVLFRVSVNILFYLLLCTRPSLDILGKYSITLFPEFPTINIAGIIAVLSIIVSIVIIYKSKISVLAIPLSFIFIGLFLIYILFTILSAYPIISINELIRVLSFLIMYVTGYVLIKSKKDCINFIKVVIMSSIIPVIIGYLQLLNGTGLYTNPGFENRIAGTFGHPNVLGYFLLIIIALMVYLFFEKNIIAKPKFKYMFILYGILSVILLISTYTRGAWIGLFVFLDTTNYLAGLNSYKRYPSD
ncbi:MAG: hypothetical protein ACO3UU_01320 [Minisyncoccia bacterium]